MILIVIAIFFLLNVFDDHIDPIIIDVNAWPSYEVWYIAEGQGYFGDTFIEIACFSKWKVNVSSLYKDNIDITHSTYFMSLYYANKGESAESILISSYILGADGLVVDKELESPGEFNGAEIAVEINTDENFLLCKALHNLGIEDKNVYIVSTTSEKAAEIFYRRHCRCLFYL